MLAFNFNLILALIRRTCSAMAFRFRYAMNELMAQPTVTVIISVEEAITASFVVTSKSVIENSFSSYQGFSNEMQSPSQLTRAVESLHFLSSTGVAMVVFPSVAFSFTFFPFLSFVVPFSLFPFLSSLSYLFLEMVLLPVGELLSSEAEGSVDGLEDGLEDGATGTTSFGFGTGFGLTGTTTFGTGFGRTAGAGSGAGVGLTVGFGYTTGSSPALYNTVTLFFFTSSSVIVY